MTTMTYQNIPIVMYHDISLVENPWCVTPENFTQHMQFLKENGYTTITLDELHNGIAANKQTEEKLIVITFDDARQGVWKHAFPLLRELGFTATVYIVPTWVDGKNVPPLENYSNFMTWGQLEQLHNAGWTIGSHSYSHQDLVKTSHLSGELEHADRRIKELLGVDVRHFSYPYGIFSAKVVEAVTKRYTTAVSIQKGFAKIPGTFSRQWILHATSLSHFRSLLKKPTLSLCMIVKNEQDCLARCLNSAKNVVDEIIIGDTGSTDTTKEIAMQFTKKVIDVPWQNDFSVARNEVLKHATSDWILILDADEILDTQASDVIEQAVHETQISGFNLLTKNYTNDTALQGYQPGDPAKRYTGWIPSLKVRLFRKLPGVEFEGTVHEMVNDSLTTLGGKIAQLPAVVHHYGFTQGKTETYLKLTQQKIVQNPEDAHAYFQLGIQRKQLGHFQEAEQAFVQSLSLDAKQAPPLLNLALVQQKQGKISEAVSNYKKLLAKQPDADAHFGLGYCFFKKNELTLAEHHFSMAIKLNPQFIDAYVNLGAISERRERYGEAEKYLKTALQWQSTHPLLLHNLGVVYEKTYQLPLALQYYEQAFQCNHPKKRQLQEKINNIKEFLKNHS